MKSVFVLLGGVAIGFCGGVFLRDLVRGPGEGVPVQERAPQSEARRVVAPPSVGETPSLGEANRCAEEQAFIVRLRARVRDLEAKVASIQPVLGEVPELSDPRCTPVRWPEDIDPSYREDALNAALGGHEQKFEFSLDCSEFPCIAAIEDTPDNRVDLESFKKSKYAGAHFEEKRFVGGGPNGRRDMYFFAALPTDEVNEDLIERIEGRFDAQIRAVMREAREP